MKGLTLGNRASLNLELALLMMLLVLAIVSALGPLGQGIANIYNSASGSFDIAGGTTSGPDGGGAADSGGGSYEIGWSGGTPPFQVIRSVQPDLSDPVIAGSTPGRSYTVLPEPGFNYYQVIDGDGRRLPAPVVITLPPVGWATNAHNGAGVGTPALRPEMGFADGDTLACGDCHDESHASPNPYNLRESVHAKTGATTADGLLVVPLPGNGADLRFFCDSCHDVSPATHPGPTEGGADLSVFPIDCNESGCHTHAGTGL